MRVDVSHARLRWKKGITETGTVTAQNVIYAPYAVSSSRCTKAQAKRTRSSGHHLNNMKRLARKNNQQILLQHRATIDKERYCYSISLGIERSGRIFFQVSGMIRTASLVSQAPAARIKALSPATVRPTEPMPAHCIPNPGRIVWSRLSKESAGTLWLMDGDIDFFPDDIGK